MAVPSEFHDLTVAMQRQLELLTRAVDELKDERKSMRNSFLALTDNRVVDDVMMGRDNAAGTVQRYFEAQRGRRGQMQVCTHARAGVGVTGVPSAALCSCMCAHV
jgi:nephrocystin-4